MRKSFKHILAALAATAALAGCAKEISTEKVVIVPDSQVSAAEGSRIIIVSFAPQTKTYLDTDGLQPKFENNDKILVSNGGRKEVCSITIDGNGNASFSTTLTDTLTAVYPAAAAKLNGAVIEGIIVPTVQDGTFASANICMAEDITTSASFVNQTAVFRIIANAEAKCVEVSANGEAIANSASGDYSDLNKIHVEADAGDTVFVSILPADHIVEDLSLSDSTTTKTFAGNKTQVAVNTFYTTAITADNFYIVGGTYFDWDLMSRTGDKKFTHSEKPIVEDPWFTITFHSRYSEDTWFAITDDAVCDAEDWPHVFGTTKGNGNSGDSGFAARRKYLGDDGAFCVPYGCDSIKVDFNALTFEYRVTEIGTVTPSVTFPDYIYEIGNEGGWDHKNSHPLVKLAGLAGFPGVEDGIYQGYYYLNGEYKFKPNADDWVGDWEFGGSYDDNEGMNMMVNGGPNFPLTEGEGFYQINVDLNTMKARLVKVESIGLVGDFNGWGNDVEMTYDVAGGYWECDATLNKNGVKVRMNHDWKTNWGGQTDTSFDNLQQNGKNFIVSAGTYHVKFYLSCEGQNHIVFELIE